MINFLKLIFLIPIICSTLFGQDSLKAIELGYLDSLKGVYTLDKVPYTGPVFKKLGIGLMTGSYK